MNRFFLLLLPCFLIACGAKNAHLGTWFSKDDEGREVQLVFHEDSTLKLSAAGKVIINDEPNLMENGDKLEIRARLDESKSPMNLDFVMYINEKADESKSMRCLLNMLSEDEMEFQIERNSSVRPAKIDTASPGYLLFKRMK